MSYSATNWVDGATPVNASNLNKLEGGVADLSDQVDELNTTTYITIDNPGTVDGVTISSWNVYVFKCGNVVELRMNCNINLSTAWVTYTLFTLPTGYCPSSMTIVRSYSTQSGVAHLLQINTNGTVAVYKGEDVNSTWGLRQSVVYLVV